MSDAVFLGPLTAPKPGDVVRLDGEEGRHAGLVRRIGVGESVVITDGTGLGVRGPVVAASKSGISVEVVEVLHSPEPAPRFVAVQALPKGDRAELAVDLLTELGVDEIIPWQASRCVARWAPERVEKSHGRWVATAREAAKQSRRLRVPLVAPLASTRQVAERLARAAAAYVLHEEAVRPIATLKVPTEGEVVFVVGPEGGIAPAEMEEFVAAGGLPVLLGETVLRTSTAGPVGLTQLRLLADLARA